MNIRTLAPFVAIAGRIPVVASNRQAGRTGALSGSGHHAAEAESGGQRETAAAVPVGRDDRHQPQGRGKGAEAAARLLRRGRQAHQGSDGCSPAQAASPDRGGRRGGRVAKRVVENKKDDMQDYMEQAVTLIQKYVPPNPDAIQKAKDGGKMTVTRRRRASSAWSSVILSSRRIS